jgi:DNA adenine methylase
MLDLAVAGIFFNRANFSGVIGAKPIGGIGQKSEYTIDCRWNVEALVDKICSIAEYGSRIRVCQGDAVAFLKRAQKRISAQSKKNNALVYVDPPYYVQGWKLYRHYFKDKDHERLADYLDRFRHPWLCSYDNHKRIHELFAGPGRKIIPINLQYTVRKNRRVTELLITNCKFLPDLDDTLDLNIPVVEMEEQARFKKVQ